MAETASTLLLEWSFLITMLLLFGSAFITGFECLNSRFNEQKRDPSIVSALQIETAVSLIAGFVYFYIFRETTVGNFTNVLTFRYVDWFVTTPLMLFSFTLFSESHIRSKGNKNEEYLILYQWLPLVIAANWVMLITGYASERMRIQANGQWDAVSGSLFAIGFVAFAATILGLFFVNEDAILLYTKYDDARNQISNELLWVFIIFTVLWALYGVFSALKDGNVAKFIGYNGLDVLSKTFFGLYLWFKASNIRERVIFY